MPEKEPAVDAERFASLVSHELRGPLATLIGYAQLLTQHEVTQSTRHNAERSILDQAKRLNLMLETLLQASRLSAHRLRVDRSPVELIGLAKTVVEQQQAAAPHHAILLNAPDDPVRGEWDPALISLALGNVIANATKFSPSGGQITVSVVLENGDALVRVVDQGIGIAREDLDRVFQPYSRPARTAHYPGMGVGLYVAKGIVEAHGGQIAVQSSVGQGATFLLRLPLG